ncbi:porin family protein [Pseudomonas sp. MYb185]|uniref:porin family protein n=1 Tax=Pseudomonas sp. MYb185 TaxID=1848729 RepID=UPI000CFC7936|nr:porin family protein [Pseudomonas sp. MYb185]PRB79919.1 hypothetical protein CQ007_15065 [Pseudomonas sp. MYb185]
MFRKSLLAVMVSGLMVAGVQAAESQVNGYLFGNVGQADYDFGSYFKPFAGSVDEKDTAFKVGAGVQLNKYVGVELQYIDLGEATYKQPDYKETIEVSGYGANLVGTLPLNRFKLYGKVGYHQLEADYKAKDTFFDERASSSEKDWITSYAVGATFAINPQFEVAVEYERYNDVEYRDIEAGRDVEVDIDLATIGLRYNF